MSGPASIIARDDTLFGVCEAIGEDFGFPPSLLRILFALALFWSPLAAVSAYAGGGLLVAVSRWLVPEPLAEQADEAEAAAGGEEALQEQAQEELALAA